MVFWKNLTLILVLVIFMLFPNSLIARSRGATELEQSRCNSHSFCIKLKECKPFMELLKMSGSQSKTFVMKFFKSQMCGLDGNEPKVCCIQLPLNISLMPSSNETTFQSCQKDFHCVDLFKCDALASLTNQEKPLSSTMTELIRSQQCGWNEGQPKVCCKGKLVDRTPGSVAQLQDPDSTAQNQSLAKDNSKNVIKKPVNVVMLKAISNQNNAINPANLLDLKLFDVIPFDLLRRRRQFKNLEPDVDVEIR